MPDSFYFPVFTGILTSEHKENIGPALWEFLWLVAKTTKEVTKDDETIGIVLNGKPVKVSEIANDLGSGSSSVRRNLLRLKEHNYIETVRTPYGETFKVKNSKKFIKNRSPKKKEVSNMKKRTLESEQSVLEESAHKWERDSSLMVQRTLESEHSNKIERIERDIKTTTRQKYDEDNTYFKMAKYFHEKVSAVANEAGVAHLIKRSNLQTWSDDMRKLIEINQVDKKLAKEVMDWVTEDSFWKTNVLSAKKLREKFTELAIKMNAEKKPTQPKQKPQYDPRDKEIALQRWIQDGNDPDAFDWSN